LPVAVKTNSSSRVIKSLRLPVEASPIVEVRCLETPLADAVASDQPGADVSRSPEELLAAARAQAKAILEHAQVQAQAALRQAEQEAAVLQARAREQGLAEGRRQGLDEGKAAAEQANRQLALRLVGLSAAAEAEQERLLEAAELQLVELALAIARKIVGEELRITPELVVEVVAHAIDEAKEKGEHTIRLNPEDIALLQPYLPRAAIEAGGSEWQLQPDESLQRGDCVIETAYGTIDARIETQFEELSRLLRGGDDGTH